MSATVKKKEEESEKKKKLDEPASSSSSLDVLTEGLKRSILPQIRKLDGTIANARWMQKEVTDATDQCSLEVERVISTMAGGEEEDKTKKGEIEEEEIDERLRNVLESVSKLRQRMAKVVERERAQREKLLRMRRCDLDVLRANKGEECDFEAVLRAEAYAKQQR